MRKDTDMNDRQWAGRLRERLSAHQEPAPSELWEDIATALDRQAATQRHARVIAIRRWAAAAAIALIVAGVGITYFRHDSSAAYKGHSRQQAKSLAESNIEDTAEKGHTNASKVASLAYVNDTFTHRKGHVYDEESIEKENLSELTTPEKAVAALREEPSKQTETTDTREEKHKLPKPAVRHGSTRTTRTYDAALIAANEKRHSSRWSAGAYASNAFMANTSANISSQPVMMSQSSVMSFMAAANMPKSPAHVPLYTSNAKDKADHKMPVSVGVTVRYGLTDRWSLETGLVYTRLKSEFTHQTGEDKMVDEQSLDYIGVPLRAQYRLLSWRGLSAYVSAGAQADMNVNARVKSQGGERKLEKDHMQWSAGASAGIQYDFIPQIGIYIEPGAQYYFDNNSPIQNIYKEHPWNFTLNLGLRININNK